MAQIKQADILARLIERLHTTSSLTALVPVASIRNYLPQVNAETAYQGLPYIRARLDDIDAWDTKKTTGYQVDATIDCWIGPPNLGDLKAHQIADEVMNALQRVPLVLTVGHCILARHLRTNMIAENDGRTIHAVLRFRLLTSETP